MRPSGAGPGSLSLSTVYIGCLMFLCCEPVLSHTVLSNPRSYTQPTISREGFGTGPIKENRQFMLQPPELPGAFQESVFKGQVWERASQSIDQFMHNSLNDRR